VLFIAVEAEDLVNVGEKLTPKVQAALPKIISRVEREAERK